MGERKYIIEEHKTEPITLPDSKRIKTVLNIAKITEGSRNEGKSEGNDGETGTD